MSYLSRAVRLSAGPKVGGRRSPARVARSLRDWRIVLRGGSLLLVVLVWTVLASLPAARKIPGPIAVLHAAIAVDAATYLRATGTSLLRVLAGFLLGAAVGIPLGIAIGYWRLFRDLTFPAIEFLRPIPPIAWIPLSILFFTNVEAQIVFLTFYGAFFPIVYNTVEGVAGVNRILVRAARSLGASELQVFRRIILPAAKPPIFTGLTIAMGVTWLMVVAAEMIAARGGLGLLTWEAYTTLNYPLIFVGMALIGVVGSLSSVVIRLIGRRTMRWQRVA